MPIVDKLTPAIGATISGTDFSHPVTTATYDDIYQALLDHQVIFIRGANIDPKGHLAFAKSFGKLDEPHLLYPHLEGFENIVLLENDANTPPTPIAGTPI